jgi:thiol-disulfide isomerase/thioredoxin
MIRLFVLAAVMVSSSLIVSAEYPRKVLLEEFTNASCPACASQNPILETFIKNNVKDGRFIMAFSRSEFPGRDIMHDLNPEEYNARVQYKGGRITGVPTLLVNGEAGTPTINAYEGAPADTNAIKNAIAAVPATSPISMTVKFDKEAKTIAVTVVSDEAITNKVLQMYVMEEIVFHDNAGTNGETEFPHVVRDFVPDASGTLINLAAGEEKTFTESVEFNSAWGEEEILYAIAFVEDPQTQEILQVEEDKGAVPSEKFEVAIEAAEDFTLLPRSSSKTVDVVVKNDNDMATDVVLSINEEASLIFNGFTAELSETEINVDANSEKTVQLTINTPANAAYLNIVINAITDNDGYIDVAAQGSVQALSENTKNAVVGLSTNAILYFNPMTANTDINQDLAYIPYTDAVSENVALSDFDLLVFELGQNPIAATGGLNVAAQIQAALDNGKKVFLTSNVALYFAFDNQAPDATRNNVDAVNFFNNTLGVNYMRLNNYVVNNQLRQMPVAGEDNDPITDGFIATGNNSVQMFDRYSTVMSLLPNSISEPILSIDGNVNNIAGVRWQKDGAKLVYMSFGIQAFSDETVRNELVDKVVAWLLKDGVDTRPAEISVASPFVDFEKTVVGQSDTQTIAITNDGEENLVISDITVMDGSMESTIFMLSETVTLPLTIEPGASTSMDVTFTPKEAESYSHSVSFTSNASNNDDITLLLNGQGEATSVNEGFAGETLTAQVGPNPVSDKATVSYNVTGSARVMTVKVFNTNGQEVMTLLNETVQAGAGSVELNSVGLPSGSYQVVLQAGADRVIVPVSITK